MKDIEMKHDVFVSYSSIDQKIVEGLSAYLEQNGIRCFVAYRDIPPGVVWAAKIPDAIIGTKMTVVVFSDNFNSSPQTDREIEICMNEGKKILPFRIQNSKYTGAKSYFLTNLHHIDAFPEPEMWFGKLCEQILNMYPELRRVAPPVAVAEAGPKPAAGRGGLSNVRKHNENFTGREREIQDIRKTLDKEYKIAAVHGLPGIGKSTVAYEYAHEFADFYGGGRFVFNASDETGKENNGDFRFALVSLATLMEISLSEEERNNRELLCQRVWGVIKQGPPTLLILDNVDNPDILKRIAEYAPDRDKLHILVTSRRGFAAGDDIRQFPINPLERQKSLDLLLKFFPAENGGEMAPAVEFAGA